MISRTPPMMHQAFKVSSLPIAWQTGYMSALFRDGEHSLFDLSLYHDQGEQKKENQGLLIFRSMPGDKAGR